MVDAVNKIPLFKVRMSMAAHESVGAVLKSGYIAEGPKVVAFEQELGKRFENDSLVVVNSATSALHLAMHLIGIGPGDEVITTAQTCIATNVAILHFGATPVFVDVDPLTGNICAQDVEDNLTAKTKAIIAVDWGGRPCDYRALRSHGLPVIEDAAHALGTTYDGGHVAQKGGDYVVFSFQAIKHLTCGDGGALVVPRDQLERARKLRWFGLDRQTKMRFRFAQDVAEVGYKFHLNDIHAAIGLANLPGTEDALIKHRENAYRLHQALKDCAGITVPKYDARSSYWLFTILVNDPIDFIDKMAEKGIECSPAHTRNDVNTAFQGARKSKKLEGLEHFSKHQVSIPVGWWLTQNDIRLIVDAAKWATNS